jgi:diacylglycerol kinase (ATP)
MRPRTLEGSLNRAIKGIASAIKTQRNMKFHLLVAAGVLILSIMLKLKTIEFLFVTLAVTTVLVAELANTALESVMDLLTKGYNREVRRAKDVAAGAVLLTVVFACLVGYFILVRQAAPFVERISLWTLERPWHLSLSSFLLVLILVMVIKGYFHKGSPMRGGMPSGHAAISFSIWVMTTYVSGNGFVSCLTLGLAVLVAQSRVRKKIHNEWEVIAGAVLGSLITLMIFQLFW